MYNEPQLLLILWVLIFVIARPSWSLINLNPSMVLGRVVGGSNAVADSAPFIVSFQYKGTHYCAGSIISNTWVLTAAHCLKSTITQVKETTLVAGSIYVAGTSVTTQKRAIDKYVINDLYLGGTSPYDIGLVYTKTPFIWSSAVSAISVATTDYKARGNALLYGWGSTSKTDIPAYPKILQVANVPIISLNACELALGAKGKDLHNTNLCTGPLTSGVGICTSDSGGPLIQNNILVGVVSWGRIPCGQIKSPSVYVKVSSVFSWIHQN